MKTIKIKNYTPSDVSFFRNANGTFGISAVVTAVSDKDEQVFQKRVRVDLDEEDTEDIERILMRFLTKAEEKGIL